MESACERLATGLGVTGPVSSLHPLHSAQRRRQGKSVAPHAPHAPPQPLNVFLRGVVLHVECQDLIVAVALQQQ